jgi:hypothetical protein
MLKKKVPSEIQKYLFYKLTFRNTNSYPKGLFLRIKVYVDKTFYLKNQLTKK